MFAADPVEKGTSLHTSGKEIFSSDTDAWKSVHRKTLRLAVLETVPKKHYGKHTNAIEEDILLKRIRARTR